jgi:hypothetical protein
MLTQSEFFAWLNPELSIDEKYAPMRLLNAAPVEIDLETWDHFLGCLPPMNWTRDGFCISEATTDAPLVKGGWVTIRLAFFSLYGRKFAAHVTDQKTGPHSFAETAARIAIGAK